MTTDRIRAAVQNRGGSEGCTRPCGSKSALRCANCLIFCNCSRHDRRDVNNGCAMAWHSGGNP